MLRGWERSSRCFSNDFGLSLRLCRSRVHRSPTAPAIIPAAVEDESCQQFVDCLVFDAKIVRIYLAIMGPFTALEFRAVLFLTRETNISSAMLVLGEIESEGICSFSASKVMPRVPFVTIKSDAAKISSMGSM